MIGEVVETSASFEARYAPPPYPTTGMKVCPEKAGDSVGSSPTRVRVRDPVAWIVGRKETESRKPIDKAIIKRMVT
jgi:hypothetical protein